MKFTEADLIRSISKQSFEEFVKNFWSTVILDELVWNWHLSIMCQELQEIAERVFLGRPKMHDLVINISPGSSKSSIASILFPAWCWTRMPHMKYIGASYSRDLAYDLSRKNRDVVKSDLYKECFGIGLREDQDTKGYFVNTKGGQRFAAGSGGTVQGMHGHIIGIDDPIDPSGSVSDADQLFINNWIRRTLSGRKVDRRLTPMILIMQRLTQNDPTVQFLEKKRVRHICIPAELTDNVKPAELRKYYIDGLMDPQRLPREALEEAEHEMGAFAYAGQFLQTPVPESGGMFDVSRLRFTDRDTIYTNVVRYWDKAGTPGKAKGGRGAYTVGTKMGKGQDGRFYVIDVIRVRVNSSDREALIKRTARSDGRSVRIGIEQEPGSAGKESGEGTVRSLAGYNVRLDRPTGDKEQRADPFSVQVNAGNVVLVQAGWNEAYLDEMRYFPHSTTKDQIDASSGAFAMLARGRARVGGVRSRRTNATPEEAARS